MRHDCPRSARSLGPRAHAGADGCARADTGRRGRAARGNAPLHRPLARDDDHDGAVRSVPLDWQGPVGRYSADRASPAPSPRSQGSSRRLRPRPPRSPGSSIVAPIGTIRSGAGSILAVPPSYLRGIHTFRFLRGSLLPGQVVFDQQLAATLQVQPGDVVKLKVRAGDAYRVASGVSGVALVDGARRALPAARPAARPGARAAAADIAILPLATFARRSLRRSRRSTLATGGGAATAPASQTGVQWQVQAQSGPASLGGAPPTRWPARPASEPVERSLPGQVVSWTTSSDTPEQRRRRRPLRRNALHHAGRTRCARRARSRLPRRARHRGARPPDLGLLRARGASRRDLLALAAFESARPRPCPPERSEPWPRLLAVPLDRRRRWYRLRACARHPRCLRPCSPPLGAATGADRRRACAPSTGTVGGGPPHRRQRSASRCGSGSTSTWPCSCRQRPRLLADRPHRLLGCCQSGLEPDPLALRLHVPRPRAAVARRHARCSFVCAGASSPGSPLAPREGAPRRQRGFLLASAGRSGACNQPRSARRRSAARVRREPRPSSPPPTTSRRGSTPSSPSAPTSWRPPRPA